MIDIKKLLSKELRKIADKIDADTCEISIDEAMKYIRDFRFYNRALTADEIAVVMREGE